MVGTHARPFARTNKKKKQKFLSKEGRGEGKFEDDVKK